MSCSIRAALLALLLAGCVEPYTGPGDTDAPPPTAGCTSYQDHDADGIVWALPDYGRPPQEGAAWFESAGGEYGAGLRWGLVDLTGDGARDLVVTGRDASVPQGPSTPQLGRTRWRLHANTGQGFDEAGVEWSLPDYGRPPGEGEFWFGTTFDNSSSGLNWALLDLTGDGAPDLVVTQRDASVTLGPTTPQLGRSRWRLHANTGQGFDEAGVEWVLPDHGRPPGEGEAWFQEGTDRFSDGLNWQLLDLTGDGAVDLFVTGRDASVTQGPSTPQLGRTRWRLHTNTGQGFDEAGSEWVLPDHGRPPGEGEFWFDEGFDRYSDGLNWSLADLTGDGALDLVVTDRDASVTTGPETPQLGRSRWRLHANMGQGFDEAGVEWSLPDHGANGTDAPWFSQGFDLYSDGLNWTRADLTGDGRLDLVVTDRDASVSAGPTTPMLGRSRWRLFTNHGEGFDEAGVEWSLPDYGNPPSEGDAWFGEGFDRFTDGLDWSLTDLTGDAVPDLVVTHRDASVVAGPDTPQVGRSAWRVHAARCVD
jgi:hypothetical protein